MTNKSWALTLGIPAFLLLLAFSFTAAPRSLPSDFERYYNAGKAALACQDPYALTREIPTPGDDLTFKYLPFFAQMMMPIAALPDKYAAYAWYWIIASCYVSMLLMAASAACGKSDGDPQLAGQSAPDGNQGNKGRKLFLLALLAGAAVSCRFFVDNARLGQINIPAACCAFAGVFFALRGRNRLGGLMVGMGAALKYMPVVLIFWFLWKRNWQAALWGVLAIVAFTVVVPSLTWGWQGNLDLLNKYIHERKSMVTSVPRHDAPGQSIPAVLNRLMRDVPENNRNRHVRVNLTEQPVQTVNRIALVCILAVSATALWLTRKGVSGNAAALQAGLVFITMLLISPEARNAHFITLIWPAAAAVVAIAASLSGRKLEAALLLLAVLCSFISASDLVGRSLQAWLSACGIIGLGALCLAACSILLLRRKAIGAGES